jgi:hypothetical protein
MRKAVALLVTLFFMILFAVAVGFGLNSTKKAQQELQKEKLLLQSTVIIEDILAMLKNSQEVASIVEDKSPLSLYAFLSGSSMIPYEAGGYRVLISLQSARDKWNVNNLRDAKGKIKTQLAQSVALFLQNQGIRDDFLGILLDATNPKPMQSILRSDLFLDNPEMFQGYIVSQEHFDTIGRYYEKKYNETLFSKLDFDKMLLYEKQRDTKVDLNYATPQTWQLLTGCSKERAEVLFANAGAYESIADLELTPQEEEQLKKFNISFKEDVIRVFITLQKETLEMAVEFEYNLKTKKASRFVYKS